MAAAGRWFRAVAWGIAAVVVIAGGATAWWQYSRPREITVAVFSDTAFREHHANWQEVLQSRFQEANLIFQPAAVRWKVVSAIEDDPTGVVPGLDQRRASLALNTGLRADVLVIVTGVHEGQRTGSAVPFSHTALVVDYPEQPEQHNANLLARHLARLFGAEEDAAESETKADRRAAFSPRTAKLIRQLREYPFAAGVDGLEGAWDARVLDALIQAGAGVSPNPVAHAHKMMGESLIDGGRWRAAILHQRETVRADPQDAPARFDLAYALAKDLQDDAAVAEFRAALRLDPNSPKAHRAMAILLAKAGRNGEAIAEFSAAARLDPKNPEAYCDLGVAQVRAGNIDAGAAEFDKALALDPNFGLAHANLAAIYFLRADYKGAWREVRKARVSGSEPGPEFMANLRAKMPE